MLEGGQIQASAFQSLADLYFLSELFGPQFFWKLCWILEGRREEDSVSNA